MEQIRVFIDESGDHNMNPSVGCAFFVLGAICFTESKYVEFDKKFKKLKKDLLGSEDYVLHVEEITHPQKQKYKENLITQKFSNEEFRSYFYSRLEELIEETPMKFIVCAINKPEHLLQYQSRAENPYNFSLENIFNRIFKCHQVGNFIILPEKRNSKQDEDLMLVYENMLKQGIRFVSNQTLTSRIKEFRLAEKNENLSGAQVIDQFVTPVSRKLRKLKERKSGGIPFSAILKKIPGPHYATVFPTRKKV